MKKQMRLAGPLETSLPRARAGEGHPCLTLWDQRDCEVCCQGALRHWGGEMVCVCWGGVPHLSMCLHHFSIWCMGWCGVGLALSPQCLGLQDPSPLLGRSGLSYVPAQKYNMARPAGKHQRPQPPGRSPRALT